MYYADNEKTVFSKVTQIANINIHFNRFQEILLKISLMFKRRTRELLLNLIKKEHMK